GVGVVLQRTGGLVGAGRGQRVRGRDEGLALPVLVGEALDRVLDLGEGRDRRRERRDPREREAELDDGRGEGGEDGDEQLDDVVEVLERGGEAADGLTEPVALAEA